MKNQMIYAAAAVPSMRVADVKYNTEQIKQILHDCSDCGIVVFPELCVTGYTCADLFGSDLLLEQAEQAIDFLEVAERVLAPFGCGVEVKQFIPVNLPAFYYLDSEAVLYREIEEAMNESEDLFSDMLGNFKDELKPHQTATLYFNMRNPLVQKMVQQHPDTKLEDIIIIIYVQTLLIGGFTLRNNELGMMNDKLLSVLEGGLADE